MLWRMMRKVRGPSLQTMVSRSAGLHFATAVLAPLAKSSDVSSATPTQRAIPRMLRLRDRHLVHLHAERDRGVVADQHQHLGDAVAADRLLDLGEFGVGELGALQQRRRKAMH